MPWKCRKVIHLGCSSASVTYRLIRNIEGVIERITWRDRALIHEGATVELVVPMLVDTVPMLSTDMNNCVLTGPRILTMEVTTSILVSLSSLMTLMAKLSPCMPGSPYRHVQLFITNFVPRDRRTREYPLREDSTKRKGLRLSGNSIPSHVHSHARVTVRGKISIEDVKIGDRPDRYAICLS